VTFRVEFESVQNCDVVSRVSQRDSGGTNPQTAKITRITNQSLATTKGRVEETIQPACEAGGERASPGDGVAEPGEPNQHTSQPTKCATDECENKPDSVTRMLRLTSVACFAGSLKFVVVTPGSTSPSPGASTLSARCAGSLNDS
jgi:hypothetical protein